MKLFFFLSMFKHEESYITLIAYYYNHNKLYNITQRNKKSLI